MANMKRRFEWDPHKAESNYQKHGITFAEAALVFKNPLVLIELARIMPPKDARPSRAHKQVTVTTAMDTDVLAWLQNQGQEWQQQMNAILRAAMRQAQAHI